MRQYWKEHKAFVCLAAAYLFPAMATYLLTFDVQLSICIGGLTILAASPLIWRFVK